GHERRFGTRLERSSLPSAIAGLPEDRACLIGQLQRRARLALAGPDPRQGGEGRPGVARVAFRAVRPERLLGLRLRTIEVAACHGDLPRGVQRGHEIACEALFTESAQRVVREAVGAIEIPAQEAGI